MFTIWTQPEKVVNFDCEFDRYGDTYWDLHQYFWHMNRTYSSITVVFFLVIAIIGFPICGEVKLESTDKT